MTNKNGSFPEHRFQTHIEIQKRESIKVSEYFLFLKLKNTVFLNKTME